jgi:hypothetical protein
MKNVVRAALNTDAVENRMWLNKDRLKGKLRTSPESGMRADLSGLRSKS